MICVQSYLGGLRKACTHMCTQACSPYLCRHTRCSCPDLPLDTCDSFYRRHLQGSLHSSCNVSNLFLPAVWLISLQPQQLLSSFILLVGAIKNLPSFYSSWISSLLFTFCFLSYPRLMHLSFLHRANVSVWKNVATGRNMLRNTSSANLL